MDDIVDAGLISQEQVRDLEQGVISESDLYEQLKPYLFGGEEPVSGLILEDTGTKKSLLVWFRLNRRLPAQLCFCIFVWKIRREARWPSGCSVQV